MTAGILLLEAASTTLVWAQSRPIEGTYRNPALGYSIRIPEGLKGNTGDQAGPERGVRIPLPSGGQIVVFGEPNSLEWKNPQEGIRWELKDSDCSSTPQEVRPVLVGKLKGAKGGIVCGDNVLNLLLAFRTHGGPIYWLRLETARAHESEDEAVLKRIAASFRLIRWE